MNNPPDSLIATFDKSIWQLPPDQLELPSDSVHVYAGLLDLGPSQIQELRKVLSEDELERAGRFHFDIHRIRYIAGRGQLRLLLGRYLAVDPTTIRFEYSKYGKPSLAPPFDATGLYFNLGHSDQLALYVFAWHRNLGIDLEYKERRPVPDFTGICEHFFSPTEQAFLRATPPWNQKDVFYRCWTRKEAYLKASGEGLSRALDTFDVSLEPNEPVRLLRVKDEPEELERWTMQKLEMPDDYAGTICIEGKEWTLACWRLEDL